MTTAAGWMVAVGMLLAACGSRHEGAYGTILALAGLAALVWGTP